MPKLIAWIFGTLNFGEMKSLAVSVVTSVYNGERYLEASLSTVLEQDGVDFEVVVVDDGSTDGSASILDRLSNRDSRVRVFHQENAGLTRALIRGCAEAKGRYIARHDADDVSLPGRLRKQVAAMEAHPGLAMIGCWSDRIGPDDEFLERVSRPGCAEENGRDLIAGLRGPAGHGSMMFRREAYEAAGGYRREFYCAQDIDLWLRLIDHGQLNYLQECLYCYRVDDRSISQSHRAVQSNLAALAFRCQRARAAGHTEVDLLREAVALKRIHPGGLSAKSQQRSARSEAAYFLAACLIKQRHPNARKYLLQAIRMNPLMAKAWWRLFRTARTLKPESEVANGRDRPAPTVPGNPLA